MRLHPGLVHECDIADGVALYDGTHLLDAEWPRKKHPKRPPGQRIDRAFIHHSGSLGAAGWEGARRSVRYVRVQRKKPFPIQPYTMWAPHDELRDDDGRLVFFRLAEDDARVWSTGGLANDRSVSLCLQGDLRRSGPSPSQVQVLQAALPWLAERHGWAWSEIGDWLGWHSEATKHGAPNNKVNCPGAATVKWLRDYVDGTK